MTWLTVIGSTLYYLLLPLTTVFGWLLVLLAPILYLGSYLLSGIFLPLSLLAKFETLYIYLGVAAIIGLITGSVLQLSSAALVSIFDLNPTTEETGRSAASVRAAREQKRLEDAWQGSSLKSPQTKSIADTSMEKYAEWLDKDSGKRREEQGLFGTILEEDDDSDGF